MQSAIISPDGGTLYVLTRAIWPITSSPTAAPSPSGPAPTPTAAPSPASPPGQFTLTAYHTTDGSRLGTTATWPNSLYAPRQLITAGDDLCALSDVGVASGLPAYLIDPSTRTITRLTLPRVSGMDLIAW